MEVFTILLNATVLPKIVLWWSLEVIYMVVGIGVLSGFLICYKGLDFIILWCWSPHNLVISTDMCKYMSKITHRHICQQNKEVWFGLADHQTISARFNPTPHWRQLYSTAQNGLQYIWCCICIRLWVIFQLSIHYYLLCGESDE